MSWTRPMYCYRSVFLQVFHALQQKRNFACIAQSDVRLITRMCGQLMYCLRSVATQCFQSLHQTVTRFETTCSVDTRCSEQHTSLPQHGLCDTKWSRELQNSPKINRACFSIQKPVIYQIFPMADKSNFTASNINWQRLPQNDLES
jgi:hypothetical protein